MRSARSWFNLTLFKKNLTRFWPIWGLYLVIWLFILPISLILNNYTSSDYVRRYLFATISPAGMLLSAVFALLAACAVWSYLCNNRSACLMHTLPIRREGLFLTNFLSGLAFLAGPNLAVFLLTALAEAATGDVNMGALVMWLFSVTLIGLAFFCLATFCAMFTGHVLGLPAFYVIANVLAVGLVWLLDVTLSRFVFGYTGIEGVWKAAEWLTPVWKLTNNLEVRSAGAACRFIGLGYILIYVFFGLILAALALAVYRRRDMERAGDVVTVPWMRPVFQYGVAFCSALAFGTLLYEIFRGSLPEGAWTLLAFMLLCGAVGYFLARMLLEKSFRVFRYWKGCVPFLAALAALVCVMEFDLTGFEGRVPDESDVASVRIEGLYTQPYDTAHNMDIDTTDPAVIRAMLAIHQAVVDDRGAIENSQDNWTQREYDAQTNTGFRVVYTLKDGGTMSRDYAYKILVSESDLNDPASLTAALDALVNLPQVVGEAYGISDKPAEKLVEVALTGLELDLRGGYEQTYISVNQADWARVLEAVQADLKEGNLGRRYLMHSQERMNNCFVNDLEFTFYSDSKQDKSVSVEADPAVEYGGVETVTVGLQTTARHTLAVLDELGVLESPVSLFTQVQWEAVCAESTADSDAGSGVDLNDYIWATLGE